MPGQGGDPIGAVLDDTQNAEHLVLARTALRRSLSEDAPWYWFAEWRLCLLSPGACLVLLPCFGSERDQRALFGDSPAILQERRVDVDPSGGFHPRPWQCYPPAPNALEAIEDNGTGILRAEESLHPLHALAVVRWKRASVLRAERARLLEERERAAPPDLRSWKGRSADQAEHRARLIQALKDARLYAPWQRAQKDAALLARLQPRFDAVQARAAQEHAAAREQRLAEVAQLDERIAALDAELAELREVPAALAPLARCLG
jgi:uncharacterized small protein (DUF1192 family)